MSRLRLLLRAFWLFWHAARANAAMIDALDAALAGQRAMERAKHHETRLKAHEERSHAAGL